jgi:hypothetical protein
MVSTHPAAPLHIPTARTHTSARTISPLYLHVERRSDGRDTERSDLRGGSENGARIDRCRDLAAGPLPTPQRPWDLNAGARGSTGTWPTIRRCSCLGTQARGAGEITPGYSVLQEDRIRYVHRLMPSLPLVHVLRNPIERVWTAARRRSLSDSVRRRRDVGVMSWPQHCNPVASPAARRWSRAPFCARNHA